MVNLIFFWPYTSQTFFYPTPIRDLKADIFELHNGFIHHDLKKKLPVFWYLVKVF